MVDQPTDLFENRLDNVEEFNIVYEGPSFQNKIELSDLRKQLKSTEYLIKDLVDELHKDRKVPVDSKGVKIFLKLERGSFQEIISVVLNSPITEGLIIGCVVALFNYILNKRKKEEAKIKIDNMTNNFFFIKNVNNIASPLHQEGDKIKVFAVKNPKIYTEVFFEEKELIKEYIKELDKQSEHETYEEEFFGYLSAVDIDREKFGFTLEGSNKHIPVEFRPHLNLDEIRKILGRRIKIMANVRYRRNELYKIEIKKHELKKRKNLNDYLKKK